MDEKDRSELVVAFVVGAVVGVGAAFLMRPAPAPRALARRLVKRARHSGGELRERALRAARRSERAGSALSRVSRAVLDEFRDEVGEIVGAARRELAREVYAQLRGERGGRGARRGPRARGAHR